jgi:chromate transporter
MTTRLIEVTTPPTLSSATRLFAKIGFLSFGGPAAQIALMHRFFVEEHKWLTERQFLNALSFCMLLPGPEAMQLATYTGWRLFGTLGGLIAGLLFVLPGAVIILAFAWLYANFGDLAIISTIFTGIKAAVLIIVVEALLRVSKRALLAPSYWVIAILSFVGIFFLSLPYPLIVFIAALYGFACLPRAVEPDVEIAAPNHSALSTVVTVATWLAIWWVPLFLVASFAGQPILVEIGTFFSKLAVVTFGGAYAVLAYMGQDVVGQFGWLSAVEMVDALGLAETTPGPLILVTEFVGFMATFRDGGLALGLAGALVTLWVTFTPCFLWIFAGAPYIDAISARQRLSGALSAITAAVVGVIANLSIWFSLHVFFDEVSLNQLGWLTVWQPDVTSINVPTVILAALCGYLLLVRHWSVLKVILTSALLGVGLSYVGI